MKYEEVFTDDLLHTFNLYTPKVKNLDELKEWFKGLSRDETRLLAAADLVAKYNPDILSVHMDKTFPSYPGEGSWCFNYQHGYASPTKAFDVLLNITVESTDDIEVWLRAPVPSSGGVLAYKKAEDRPSALLLYSGQASSFHLNLMPSVYLQAYSFEIKSPSRFTVKCQVSQLSAGPRGRMFEKYLMLAVSGKPSWVAHRGQIKAYNTA